MMATRSNAVMQKDFHSLRTELRTAKAYFKDPDFPPDTRSLYFSGRVPANTGQVKWMRAKDLVKNPRFVVDGAQRHDLDQGSLGNCWFVAGAATLATSDKWLFERVVPPDQDFDQSYAGVFRFNFWWYGTWTEVVVDDYLPTNGRDLIYCHNRERPDEMWPALLEKAYAKLRGCYEALDGGKLQNAMVDLTGGISEVISLKDKNEVTYELYDLLLCAFSMKSLLGASINHPAQGKMGWEVKMSNGLYMGHAYSITGFQQLKTSKTVVRLLRVRNPWGRGEWNGAWSDNSREMQSLPPDIKAQMDARNVDEGEFWINFEDFVKNFDEIQLCHLEIDAMVEELRDNQNKQNWDVMMYHDEWIRGVTAGGCGNPPNERLYWSNPQFYLNLSKADTVLSSRGECTIIISLMKKEMNNKSSIAIGFDVYKLLRPDLWSPNERRAPKNALEMAKRSGKYEHYREVTKRIVLPPGHYFIIPSTFKPHEEAKFLLRIFTEKFGINSVMEEKTDQSMFLQFDRDKSNFVDTYELTDMFSKLAFITPAVWSPSGSAPPAPPQPYVPTTFAGQMPSAGLPYPHQPGQGAVPSAPGAYDGSWNAPYPSNPAEGYPMPAMPSGFNPYNPYMQYPHQGYPNQGAPGYPQQAAPPYPMGQPGGYPSQQPGVPPYPQQGYPYPAYPQQQPYR